MSRPDFKPLARIKDCLLGNGSFDKNFSKEIRIFAVEFAECGQEGCNGGASKR